MGTGPIPISTGHRPLGLYHEPLRPYDQKILVRPEKEKGRISVTGRVAGRKTRRESSGPIPVPYLHLDFPIRGMGGGDDQRSSPVNLKFIGHSTSVPLSTVSSDISVG